MGVGTPVPEIGPGPRVLKGDVPVVTLQGRMKAGTKDLNEYQGVACNWGLLINGGSQKIVYKWQ